MDDKDRSWEELLNPEVLRSRLIAASIFIAGYEALEESIVDRIRYFFVSGFGASGETVDPQYEQEVLSRHKNKVRASLDWLKWMSAVDDDDLAAFKRVKDCRNVLAHELLASLGSDGLPQGFEERFQEMVALLRKIEIWWIVNVEIPTNPDIDPEAVDEEGIVPGPVMALQLLTDIALGDDEKSRYYYEEFRKRRREYE